MNTRKIAMTITKTLCFIAIVVLMAACDNDFGTMHLNRSMNMDHLNWIPILISLGIGFILGMLFSKRRRW
jgi:hypothetical protein